MCLARRTGGAPGSCSAPIRTVWFLWWMPRMWIDSVWQGRNSTSYLGHPALKKMPLLVLCNKSDGQTQPTENPVHADAEAPAPAPAPADSSSESDDEGKKDETKEAPKTDEPPATPRSSQIR